MRYVPLLLGLSPLFAQSPSDFFESKIRPVLSANCFGCHNANLKTAGLDLSTASGFEHGGAASKLLQVLSYKDRVKMPPKGKLSDAQIADIAAWVALGAPWPNSVSTAAPAKPGSHYEFTPEQRAFWAFQKVKDPLVPSVTDRAWPKTPIDNFIMAKLEEAKLSPARPADKLALLRRATFDLIGLPPTPGEIDAFLADNTSGAFAKVVDRLLASPRYGERWGRHWLDVARYADSTGADEDIRYPYAYRYRDYVIDSFNSDLPYNQFVAEQLAGDLLPAAKAGEVNTRGIVATGFLAIGLKLLAEVDKPKMVYDMVDEQIDATSRAFMGVTVACARCHDHKFDPIPTKDYYSMAGIFASTKSLAKVDGTVSQIYFAPLVPSAEYERYEHHQKLVEAKSKQIAAVVAGEALRYTAALKPHLAEYMLADGKEALDAKVLERWTDYLKENGDVRTHLDRWFQAKKSGPAVVAEAARAYQKEYDERWLEWEARIQEWRKKVADSPDPPDKPTFEGGKDRFFEEVSFDKGPFAMPEVSAGKKDASDKARANQERLFSAESKVALRVLEGQLAELRKQSPPEPPMACAVAEGAPVDQHILLRGNVASPGEPAPKQFLQIIAGENQTPVTKGSGRLELARWLADPNHPLTARVMVNRIWQYHFAEGLVRTPNNFGRLGDAPSHPELLDYLASRFVEGGWSVKKMHRLIMLSSAYQMSSQVSKQQAEGDPSNRLLSHFNRRRLDVEEIRDGLLEADGSLDLTMGGTLQSGFGTDEENGSGRLSIDPASSKRRTVYLPLRRSNLPSLLNLFDFGDATTPSEGRDRTNVAPQALFMMNSKFIRERSQDLAKKLLSEPSADDRARIADAFLAIYGRRPTADESAELLLYVENTKKKSTQAQAWQSFCRILISSNEFIYLD